jgi:hypothetical protein
MKNRGVPIVAILDALGFLGSIPIARSNKYISFPIPSFFILFEITIVVLLRAQLRVEFCL